MKLTPIMVLVLLVSGMILFAQPSTQPAGGEKVVTNSGLTIITTQEGEPGAKKGDIVLVLYTGKLTDGTVFDASSMHGNDPIQVRLGGGQVIKGWEEGLLGMQIGEKRHLVIPANLAYGEQSRGDKIPPNSTLEFDIELVGLLRQ